MLLAGPLGAFGAGAGDVEAVGSLKVNSSPALPTLISLDGIVLDGSAVKKVPVAAGDHTLSFSDVPGYETPSDIAISVADGGTTTINAEFALLGLLRVVSQPAVKTTISVDGVPSNDFGLWTYIVPGSHTVSFGPVAGYDTPANQTVNVRSGGQEVITGVFVSDVNATGSTQGGMLRVVTSPALPSTISIDGKVRDAWGLNWLTLEPGTYVVSFSDVPGFTTPDPQTVEVKDGLVTEITGAFVQQGGLRVITSPPDSAVISIDGVPRDSWGVWVTLPPGSYTISFGDVPGHPTPGPQTILVVPGQITLVIGMYRA